MDTQTPEYVLSSTCQIKDLSTILKLFLGYKTEGYFVECGAFDGEYVSNTSGLADLGWNGIYIEPVHEFFEKCARRHAHNKVRVLNLAVGDRRSIVEISKGGPLSTISPEVLDKFKSLEWAKGFHSDSWQKVQQETLNEILKSNNAPVGFDLLSIDVEGFEWNVLQGFDIERWRPKIVIIELHDNNPTYDNEWGQARMIVDYFRDRGYRPVLKDLTNTVYLRNDIQQEVITMNQNVSEHYSNLLDLREFFAGLEDYVILKLPECFPNYRDYSDIDILCRNMQQAAGHIVGIGKRYESKGFTIVTSLDNGHTHIDFFAPGAKNLNVRFDLIDSISGYRTCVVDPEYHLRVLETKQEIVHNGTTICVPSLEHDLAIRFLEYIEWKDERPSKHKHFEYVKSKQTLVFLDVINRYTNLNAFLDPKDNTIQVMQRNDGIRQELAGVKPRMDYFMIWGHGLKYTEEILDTLRRSDGFEIVAVIRKHIDDMGQFVSDIYRCDSVPFHHLVAKTRYLLTTEPEILFILTRNVSPREALVGEGAFRHIQCLKVKDIKENIRNRFNPRVDGRRTEDHVIHASDYESQVAHVLKVLNLPPLEYYTRQPNADLDIPYHLEPFDRYEIRQVALGSLHANILDRGLVPVSETPHYKYLTGDKNEYQSYHRTHAGSRLTDDHFPKAFDEMIRNFQYDFRARNGKRSLIVAKEVTGGRYQILDGVHRAAILKSRNVDSVTIAVPLQDRSNPKISRSVGIIFSKDRAMQLDAVLRSFFLHCTDAGSIDLKVLYATSDGRHAQQYSQLAREYQQVEFVREHHFKQDLLALLGSAEHILFLVDDNMFVRNFAIGECVEALQKTPGLLGVSLRLGKNTTYCYMLDRSQAIPDVKEEKHGLLRFNWTNAECDFGYPLEVSSSLYRVSDLLPILTKLEYRNPNTLELQLDANKEIFRESNQFLACYPSSVTFCIPINTVQREFLNRSGRDRNLTPESLADDFSGGRRFDVASMSGFEPDACHQEYDVPYEPASEQQLGTTMLENALTSIVLLNYNGYAEIKLCLESIARNTPEPHEIIVVDNASTDGSLAYLRGLKEVMLVENSSNLGCPPARAQGLSLASGEYVVLLDNDTLVTAGWLGRLIAHARSNQAIGIMGPRSNYVSGEQIVLGTGYTDVPGLERFAARWSRDHRLQQTPALRLVGFCMFIRREVIDKIGNIDASFGKFGFEDDDYTWRARIAGFNTVIAQDVFIHHTGGPQGRGNNEYNQQLLQAWEIFKRKWGIPEEVVYGAPFDVENILARPFDPAKHFIPLPDPGNVKSLIRSDLAHTEELERNFAMGVSLARRGEHTEALDRFNRTLMMLKDPQARSEEVTLYAVHMCIGDSYLCEGDLQEASKSFERALRLEPQSAEACYGLGRCFQSASLNDAARQMYEVALALRPDWRSVEDRLKECACPV